MRNQTIKIKNLYINIIMILLYWCVFQDFVLSLLYRVTGATGFVKILLYSKDMLFVLLIVMSVIRTRLNHMLFVSILLYYFFVFFQTLMALGNSSANSNIVSLFSSLRGLVLLPAFFTVGAAVNNKDFFLDKTQKYLRFLTIIAIISLAELLINNIIGTRSFWMDFLGLGQYHIAIKGQPDDIYAGVPWNWYTSGIHGPMTRKRLVGPWGAPLAAGFILLVPCIYYTVITMDNKALARRGRKKDKSKTIIYLLILIGAVLSTVTRQVILPYFVIALLYFIFSSKGDNKKYLLTVAMILAVPVAVAAYSVLYEYIFNGSTAVHIMQINSALRHVTFIGNGVGTFGTRFAGTIATESQYLTVLGQLGVIPFILYLFIYFYPIFYCLKRVKGLPIGARQFVITICLSGLIFGLAGIVSETVAAFTSIAQYYIFIGFSYKYCKTYSGVNNEYKSNSHVPATIS